MGLGFESENLIITLLWLYYYGYAIFFVLGMLNYNRMFSEESAAFNTCANELISFFQINAIDAVNQGNWSLSIKLRLECFVIVV